MHASDDLRRSDAAWAESQSMCETTTMLLRQEAEEAERAQTEIEAHVLSLQQKFNETKKLVRSKRKGIDRITVDISTIVNSELKEAQDKLAAATEKLNKAIDAARPENSRLTLAIAKTERIIDSIRVNTAAAANEDEQVAEAEQPAEKSPDAEATDASDPASAMLEIDANDPVDSVGPRFVAAIVKLNDLKIGLEKLRNNSMQVFELKRVHAESQSNYATEVMRKIATGLNVTRKDLEMTRSMIVRMEAELVNLTETEATLSERLVIVKDNYRRSSVASEEVSTFCKSTHQEYKEARKRASGIGAVVDEVTELTTSRMAQIQGHIIEAKMDVLDTAIEHSKQDIPSSYNRLYDELRGKKGETKQDGGDEDGGEKETR